MENLKNTITKTDTLKNNLKTVTNKIKQSIMRGGGSDFKSLDKAPERIKDLLGKYSKIAIGEYNQNNLNNAGLVRIPVNLSFNPKKIFVMLQWKNCAAGFADSTKNTNRENALDYSLGGKSIYVYSYSNKHIEVGNSHNGYLSGAIKFIWIAIG